MSAVPAFQVTLAWQGKALGGGILVDSRHVVSAAHVLERLPADLPAFPEIEIRWLDGPGGSSTTALVECVLDGGRGTGEGDVAVFRTRSEIADVEPPTLVSRTVATGLDYRVMRAGQSSPDAISTGSVVGPVGVNWLQLRTHEQRDYGLEKGFSGSPLVYLDRFVLGLVSGRRPSDEHGPFLTAWAVSPEAWTRSGQRCIVGELSEIAFVDVGQHRPLVVERLSKRDLSAWPHWAVGVIVLLLAAGGFLASQAPIPTVVPVVLWLLTALSFGVWALYWYVRVSARVSGAFVVPIPLGGRLALVESRKHSLWLTTVSVQCWCGRAMVCGGGFETLSFQCGLGATHDVVFDLAWLPGEAPE